MRTTEEAFNDVNSSTNAQRLGIEAMVIEYRTTGKMSIQRAIAIASRFNRRGVEMEDARGEMRDRAARTTISVIARLSQNGPEALFGERGEFWMYGATPEERERVFAAFDARKEDDDDNDGS